MDSRVPSLLYPVLAVFAALASARPARGEGELGDLRDAVAGEVGSQVFFDAAHTGFNKDGSRQTFDGDFVAIGAGTIFAADHVALDRAKGVVEASGHVIVMSESAIFTGERVQYLLKTGDFKIDGATMTVNDAAQAEAITRQILGLTAKEAEFEAKRELRLAEIADRKARLRNEARRQAHAPEALGAPPEAPKDVDQGLVERYARLLDQEELTAKQPNPSLSRIPKERRAMILRRRDFFAKSRAGVAGLKRGKAAPAALYFKVRGDELTRTDGNDFHARAALFTPCICADDEAPAWAFRSAEMNAQIGGYADLNHPVLEIKGIPVLYLPYLKIPLKDERQSGFLMPTIAYEARSGTIYSQPVFFDLGKDADATLTTDVFENRGTRLGLEYRIQQREFSGWELDIEAIRDHLWLEDRSKRQDFGPMYRQGLADAAARATPRCVDALLAAQKAGGDAAPEDCQYKPGSVQDPGFWKGKSGAYDVATPAGVDAAKAELDDRFGVPANTWRGAYQWRGSTFLAPRLSLVSNAEILSDHRYAEELRVPNDFQEALFGGRASKTFSDAKAQLNLDGKDLYAGLGFRYGDNNLLEERFEGQQMPLRLKLLSREASLLPPDAAIPVYAEVSAEQVRISEFGAEGAPQAGVTLGDGYWRRLRLRTVSPLITDSKVQVDQFTESDARYIEHAGLAVPRSELRSFRTGIDFTLPIDGKGEVPAWLDTKSPVCAPEAPEFNESACERRTSDPNRPVKWAHHLMDWRLRFSLRPSVVRRGPYGELENGGRLAYFGSDVPSVPGTPDPDLPDEERMKPHQIVELSTTQFWRLFSRSWTLRKAEESPAKPAAPAHKPAPEPLEERARRELLTSLDRPLTPDADLIDATNRKWLIDRYALEDQYYDTPATFHATVAYDFIDARERLAARKRNAALPVGPVVAPAKAPTPEALPEGWKDVASDLSLAHAGFSVSAAVKYGIYIRTVHEEAFGLTFPAVLRTNLSLGYVLQKTYVGNLVSANPTRTRSLSLDTSLIPSVITYIGLKKQDVDGVDLGGYTNRFSTAMGFAFGSDSKCWGLNFARSKDFKIDEGNATYVLQLSVVLMGQQRPLPSMDKGVVRDVRRQQ